MATSKLAIYNQALLLCEERRLASLTEDREPRHLLDLVWDQGAIDFCLAQAQWKHAMRSSRLEYDPSVSPDWGYRFAFQKEGDWIVTSAVCSDEHFNTPLLDYYDEVGYWWANLDLMYVRYISNGDDFGKNLGLWPQTFSDYVASHLAHRVVGKLSGGDAELKDSVKKERNERRLIAKNKDAMADPAKYPVPSSWNRARFGRGYRYGPLGDGGSGGQLIG